MEYWHKLDPKVIPHEDIEWEKPEHASRAGTLAIVGGNLHGFATVGRHFIEAQKQAGSVRAIMPSSIRKFIPIHENIEFLPSTSAGSFSKEGEKELVVNLAGADCILLSGEFGKNSETQLLIESLITKTPTPLMVSGDASGALLRNEAIVDRENTIVLATLSELQKMMIAIRSMQPITFGMSLAELAEALHELTKEKPINIVTLHHERLMVASDGFVSSIEYGADTWRDDAAVTTAVYAMQHPGKWSRALANAVWKIKRASGGS